jgi:hypothetical protein
MRVNGDAGSGHLTLFFHSLGNNVLREIVQHGLSSRYSDAIWVDNIILNAPCVPRRNSKRWIDSLRMSRHVFVHYNPHDESLKWARILSFGGILGERPANPLSQRAVYINFNTLCGSSHSNFLNVPGRAPAKAAAIAHYRHLLHGDESGSEANKNSYRVSIYKGIGLDLLAL